MRKAFLRACYYSILILTSMLLISCDENEKKLPSTIVRPVKAIQVGSPKSFEGRYFPGRAKASQEVNLSFNVSGSLIELPVKIGDKVKKDDLIAKLDPREFDAKLKSSQAEATRDKKNYLRAKELVEKGHVSRSDYDILESKWTISEANLNLAEKALIDSVIKAPFDGQIANLHVENFQNVSKKQTIARLLNISEIEMVIQIPENVISFIPYAKNITIKFDAFPDHTILAKIKEISNEASTDTRTYPVTIIFKQPKDVVILPGMAGKVTGQIEEKNSQIKLTVPSSAVLTIGADNKTYVWIINSKTNQVNLQEITLGELRPTGISVLSGLKPGDLVVIAGIHSLKEGESVAILNQEDK